MLKFLLVLALSPISLSSQIAQQEPQKLASAPLVIVARVLKVTTVRDEGIYGRELIVSLTPIFHIKGVTPEKEINIRTSQGGLKGFDLTYKPGDLGVFFFQKVEEGQGQLLHHGSVSFFDSSYFTK